MKNPWLAMHASGIHIGLKPPIACKLLLKSLKELQSNDFSLRARRFQGGIRDSHPRAGDLVGQALAQVEKKSSVGIKAHPSATASSSGEKTTKPFTACVFMRSKELSELFLP